MSKLNQNLKEKSYQVYKLRNELVRVISDNRDAKSDEVNQVWVRLVGIVDEIRGMEDEAL